MRMPDVGPLSIAAIICLSTVPAAGRDALLADAVQRRDTRAVLALLQQHADVNAPQSDGATALHWAAYFDDAETTGRLIRACAKVDIPKIGRASCRERRRS